MKQKHQMRYPFATDIQPLPEPAPMKHDFYNNISDIEGAKAAPLHFSAALHRVPQPRRYNIDVSDITGRYECKKRDLSTRRDFYDPQDINASTQRKSQREVNPVDPVYDWRHAEQSEIMENSRQRAAGRKDSNYKDKTLRTNDIFGKQEATEQMMRTKYGNRGEIHHFGDVSDINGPKTGGLTYYKPTQRSKSGENPFYDYDFFKDQAQLAHIQKVQQKAVILPEPYCQKERLEQRDARVAGISTEPQIAVCHQSIGCLPGPDKSIYLKNSMRFQKLKSEELLQPQQVEDHDPSEKLQERRGYTVNLLTVQNDAE